MTSWIKSKCPQKIKVENNGATDTTPVNEQLTIEAFCQNHSSSNIEIMQEI